MALSTKLTILNCFALGLLAIGLLLHIIGLATPGWSITPTSSGPIYVGLWKICPATASCYDYADNPYVTKPDKLNASEAFALIGMIFAIGALGLGIFYILLQFMGKTLHALIPIGVAMASGVALLTIIIGCIIWGAGIHDDRQDVLGYSFTLSLVGGFYVAIGGVLIFIASVLTVD